MCNLRVMAALGLEIDYKLISIAQVGKDLVVPLHAVPKIDTRPEYLENHAEPGEQFFRNRGHSGSQ